MSYDPNQPQQPQPPYGQPQPPYEQLQGEQQPLSYSGQPQQPPYGQPPPQPQYTPTQYGVPYGAPPVPGYMPPQQPRQSNRWVWIILGILGGLILLSLVGCVVVFALIRGAVTQTSVSSSTIGAQSTVQQYYTAIKNQDYAIAYSYLDPNLTYTNGQPTTQSLYTFHAQSQDTSKGTVYSFTVGSISVNNYGIASVTVTVIRINTASAPYDVHLQLKQENGAWKIIFSDNI